MLEHSLAISFANADEISNLNEWQFPDSAEICILTTSYMHIYLFFDLC
jgi:hypothetical protein